MEDKDRNNQALDCACGIGGPQLGRVRVWAPNAMLACAVCRESWLGLKRISKLLILLSRISDPETLTGSPVMTIFEKAQHLYLELQQMKDDEVQRRRSQKDQVREAAADLPLLCNNIPRAEALKSRHEYVAAEPFATDVGG